MASWRATLGWFIARLPGRRSPPRPIAVTLWGKPDCSLCDKAEAILGRLKRDFPLVVTKRDITQDPEAFARFRYVIPVVELADGPRFEGKISEHRLRQTLERLVS